MDIVSYTPVPSEVRQSKPIIWILLSLPIATFVILGEILFGLVNRCSPNKQNPCGQICLKYNKEIILH